MGPGVGHKFLCGATVKQCYITATILFFPNRGVKVGLNFFQGGRQVWRTRPATWALAQSLFASVFFVTVSAIQSFHLLVYEKTTRCIRVWYSFFNPKTANAPSSNLRSNNSGTTAYQHLATLR